jgi:hypothetical protein
MSRRSITSKQSLKAAPCRAKRLHARGQVENGFADYRGAGWDFRYNNPQWDVLPLPATDAIK